MNQKLQEIFFNFSKHLFNFSIFTVSFSKFLFPQWDFSCKKKTMELQNTENMVHVYLVSSSGLLKCKEQTMF